MEEWIVGATCESNAPSGLLSWRRLFLGNAANRHGYTIATKSSDMVDQVLMKA
jgi:hypothetical protein